MPWGGMTFRHIVHLNVAARALSRSCSLLQHFVFRWMDSSISSSLSSMRLVLLWSASDGLLSTASPLFPFPCNLGTLQFYSLVLYFSACIYFHHTFAPEFWTLIIERRKNQTFKLFVYSKGVFFLRDGWRQYELNISLIIMHYNDKHMVFASQQNSQSTMPTYRSEKQHLHSLPRYRTKLR